LLGSLRCDEQGRVQRRNFRGGEVAAEKGFLVWTTLLAAVILLRMARKLRVEYPGAIYHVMNRGDRREEIFQDDPDR